MKKLLIAAFIVALTFSAFACTPNNSHQHTPVTALTELEDGFYDVTTCSECGKVISQTLRYAKIADGIFRKKDDASQFFLSGAQGLINFAETVNGTSSIALPTLLFQGRTITLLNDIDLNGIEWQKIDCDNALQSSIFDGNDKTISNFTVSGNESVGFFGTISNDLVIKNLTIDNAHVTVTGKWGGVLIGVHASGKVEMENVTVKNSSITGSIAARSIRLGALIGFCRPYEGANLVMKDCSVTDSKFTGYHTTCALIGTLSEYLSYPDRWSISGCSVKNNLFRIGTTVEKHVSPFTVDGGTYPAREENDAYFVARGNTEENNTFEYGALDE